MFKAGVYHEPDNDDRAEWARETLSTFSHEICETDTEDALSDFLCDAMHLCDRDAETFGTFENALRRARSNYEEERSEDPLCECQNCDWKGVKSAVLSEIEDYDQRVAKDEPVPDGECPSCRALCHEVQGKVS